MTQQEGALKIRTQRIQDWSGECTHQLAFYVPYIAFLCWFWVRFDQRRKELGWKEKRYWAKVKAGTNLFVQGAQLPCFELRYWIWLYELFWADKNFVSSKSIHWVGLCIFYPVVNYLCLFFLHSYWILLITSWCVRILVTIFILSYLKACKSFGYLDF